MNTREFIDEVERRLAQGNAPILYLHRNGNEGAFAVVVEREHLHKLMDLEELYGSTLQGDPENKDRFKQELEELWMNHSHLEGDEEDEPTP